MFKELAPLLQADNKLVIVLEGDGQDRYRVQVMPRGDLAKSKLGNGFAVSGTALELDAELPAALSGYVAAELSFDEQVKAAHAVIDAAKAAQQDKAATALKAANSTQPLKIAAPTARLKPGAGSDGDDEDDDAQGAEGSSVNQHQATAVAATADDVTRDLF